jgi:hypothetical protein
MCAAVISRRALRHGSPHAGPDIAAPLADDGHATRPLAAAMPGGIGGYREAEPPAAISAEPAEQPGEHDTLEAVGLAVPDIARQPPLSGAALRRAHKHDQMLAHQPYSRTIWRSGTPMK